MLQGNNLRYFGSARNN